MTDEPEENCCGNCTKFLHECVDGWGWCDAMKMESFCGIPACQFYKTTEPVISVQPEK